jgi:hypothetical protein
LIYGDFSEGNVGIGTTSPGAKLEVNGTIKTAAICEKDTFIHWKSVESNRWWQSVAMSADGTKQTAVDNCGWIYVSTDSGNTWTAKDSNRRWRCVAMSADGTIQTAVVWGGQIYVSTDSGNTWTAKGPEEYWQSVAMSADGTIQTAVVNLGMIYVSTDSGNTWTAKSGVRWYTSVAMSADGTIQTAVGDGEQIYVSTDSGNTWTAEESERKWYGVAMSADGKIQTAVVFNGQIYLYDENIHYIGVGIGTTNPMGRLDVNGSIYQRAAALHGDYVFEPGYKLETIDEHSEFMWKEKHLPEIPKRRVGDDGREIIEIGAHQRGIVEELEKAHIYIEQLHKQNKALEKRVASLEEMVSYQQFVSAKEVYNETH